MDEDVLVLADQDGDYYLVSRETIEHGRVPPEQRAEVERLLESDDVAGFNFGPLLEVDGKLRLDDYNREAEHLQLLKQVREAGRSQTPEASAKRTPAGWPVPLGILRRRPGRVQPGTA